MKMETLANICFMISFVTWVICVHLTGVKSIATWKLVTALILVLILEIAAIKILYPYLY